MYENSNSSPATPSSSSSTNTGPRNASTNGDTLPARLFLFSHELPSGDVQDLFRRLHRYAKSPNYPFLARFLGTCVSLLREEVQKLPRRQRESVPPFSDVATLGSEWEHLRNGQLGGAWEGAFVCIYELGMLIGSVCPHSIEILSLPLYLPNIPQAHDLTNPHMVTVITKGIKSFTMGTIGRP